MKYYFGIRSPEAMVYVAESDGLGNIVKSVELRQSVVHSPTGFEWGYYGSGPADTARSILCDFYEMCDLPVRQQDKTGLLSLPAVNYQVFKAAAIASVLKDQFVIPAVDIALWIIMRISTYMHLSTNGSHVVYTPVIRMAFRRAQGHLMTDVMPEKFRTWHRPLVVPIDLLDTTSVPGRVE